MNKNNVTDIKVINNKCAVEECQNNRKSKGWCSKHYHRYVRHGNPLTTVKRTGCAVEDCSNKHSAHGYCNTHLRRLKRYGDVSIVTVNLGKGLTWQEKFWSRVKKNANEKNCWEWQGCLRSPNGYGIVAVEGKSWSTHRLSWFLAHGTISDSLYVRHVVCDNKKCVNPDHLEEGTHQQNMVDMTNHNRQAKGERVHTAKLTVEKVKEIKKLLGTISQNELAKTYKVDKQIIKRIRLGVLWKHVSI